MRDGLEPAVAQVYVPSVSNLHPTNLRALTLTVALLADSKKSKPQFNGEIRILPNSHLSPFNGVSQTLDYNARPECVEHTTQQRKSGHCRKWHCNGDDGNEQALALCRSAQRTIVTPQSARTTTNTNADNGTRRWQCGPMPATIPRAYPAR